MDKLVIQPVNLIDHTNLPQITVDHALSDGDPVEYNVFHWLTEKLYSEMIKATVNLKTVMK